MKNKTKILIVLLVLVCLNSEIAMADKTDVDKSNYIMFIPIRETFEKVGYEVQWDKGSNCVLLYYEDTNIVMPIGEYYIFKNNEKINIKYPVLLFNGVSFLSTEALGTLGYTYSFSDNKILIESKSTCDINIGDKAPDFKLKDIDNNEISLNELEKEKAVLIFWASWCPYCIKEMESISFLLSNNQKDNIAIIPINVGEQIEVVKSFMMQNGYDFPVFLDKDSSVAKLYNIKAIPKMIFIDEEKNILDIKEGYYSDEEIIDILNNFTSYK